MRVLWQKSYASLMARTSVRVLCGVLCDSQEVEAYAWQACYDFVDLCGLVRYVVTSRRVLLGVTPGHLNMN